MCVCVCVCVCVCRLKLIALDFVPHKFSFSAEHKSDPNFNMPYLPVTPTDKLHSFTRMVAIMLEHVDVVLKITFYSAIIRIV